MIEQAMIFALGFLIASLLSLMILPVVSRRALRLATRRLSMLVPLSMTEIVAERDQIRAEHAAATRRLEQTIEGLTRAKADAMADAGRHATRAMALEREGAVLMGRNAALQGELTDATRAANEARAELGLQMQLLHDTLGLAERRLALLNTAEARLVASEVFVDEQRATIAGLETRGTGQDLRIRTLMAQGAATAADLRDTRTAHASVILDLGAARAEIASLGVRRDQLDAELEMAKRAILTGEQRFATKADEMAGLTARLAQQADETASLQRLLADAQTGREAMQGERDRHAEAVAKAETRGAAPRELPLSGPEEDLAALRQSIMTLAADLLKSRQERVAPAAVSDRVPAREEAGSV